MADYRDPVLAATIERLRAGPTPTPPDFSGYIQQPAEPADFSQYLAQAAPETATPEAAAEPPAAAEAPDFTGYLKAAGREALGQAEALGQVATQFNPLQLIPQAVGGLAGLTELAKSGNLDEATRRIQAVQEAAAPWLTYQPQTPEGQQYAQMAEERVTGFPAALGAAAGGAAQQATGSPTAGALADVVGQLAPWLALGATLYRPSAAEVPQAPPETAPAMPAPPIVAPEAPGAVADIRNAPSGAIAVNSSPLTGTAFANKAMAGFKGGRGVYYVDPQSGVLRLGITGGQYVDMETGRELWDVSRVDDAGKIIEGASQRIDPSSVVDVAWEPATSMNPSGALRQLKAELQKVRQPFPRLPPASAAGIPPIAPAAPEAAGVPPVALPEPAVPPPVAPAPSRPEPPPAVEHVTPDTSDWVHVRIRPQEMDLEPERFQFKQDTDVQGMHQEMREAKRFNPDLAKEVTLWRDPEDGRLKVINGHNRVGKALSEDYRGALDGRVIPARLAPDAEAARAWGAIENISEGRGTALDAAKMFRDAKFGQEDFDRLGLSPRASLVRDGLGIAALDDSLYRKVVIGELPHKQGAIIGRELPDLAQQQALLPHLAEPLSDAELRALIRQQQATWTAPTEQRGLFGTETVNKSLAVPKARLAAQIEAELAREKRTFSAAAKESAAGLLGTEGNVIHTAANARRALGAKQLLEVFDRETRLQGPVNELLNQGAQRIARGEEPDVVRPQVYAAVLEELRRAAGVDPEAVAGVGGNGPGGAEPPAQGGLFGSQAGAIRPSALIPPIVEQGAKAVRESAIRFGKLVHPGGFATDAELNSLIRTKGEEIEQNRFLYNQLSKGNEAFWDRMIGREGIGATRDFIQRMSAGMRQPTAALQKMADFYRQMLDAAALGASRFKMVPYRENYTPGIWRDPNAAETIFSARRPMAGSGRFYRAKLFQEFNEGLEAGLAPISENPEVLVRTYLEDVRRWNYAHAWFDDAKANGRLRWVAQGGQIPDGWAAIDDNITRKYFPPNQVPLVVSREELQKVVSQYATEVVRERARMTTKTRTTTEEGGEAAASPAGKVEERVREALTARGFSSGEVEQYIGRLKGSTTAGAARTVVKEITERLKTIEREVATQYNFPEEMGVRGRVNVSGYRFLPAGQWVTSEAEARLLNNSLMRDSWRADPTIRGLTAANSMLNAVELGFSGFHVGSEVSNAVSTKAGIALADLLGRRPGWGIVQAARIPTAPLEYLIKGARLWNDPLMTEDALSPLRSGARLAPPTGAFRLGSAWDAFMKNVRQRNYVAAMKGSPFAAVDLTMKPIFNYIVPRMEVGAYFDMLASEMRRNAGAIAQGTADPKTIARKTWMSVQDRMGLVNYDSWFWNQNFKTAMQLMWRAPGWNFGFAREFAGAAYDLGKGLGFTPRLQYVFGLVFAQTAAAAIYQYLHTGKPIESMADVIAPRNGDRDEAGNEMRVRFPNALKDAYGLTHKPGETFKSKLSPLINMVLELWSNRNYWGDMIYTQNRNASWNEWAQYAPQQATEIGRYLTESVRPFSYQQFSRMSQETGTMSVEPFLGITKAPRELIQSEGQRQAEMLLEQQRGERGARTPAQQQLYQQRIEAMRQIRQGNMQPFYDLAQQQKMTAAQRRQFLIDAHRTPQQRVEHLLGKKGVAQLRGTNPSPVPPPP